MMTLFAKPEVKNQIVETVNCILYSENDIQQVGIHLRMSSDD